MKAAEQTTVVQKTLLCFNEFGQKLLEVCSQNLILTMLGNDWQCGWAPHQNKNSLHSAWGQRPKKRAGGSPAAACTPRRWQPPRCHTGCAPRRTKRPTPPSCHPAPVAGQHTGHMTALLVAARRWRFVLRGTFVHFANTCSPLRRCGVTPQLSCGQCQ